MATMSLRLGKLETKWAEEEGGGGRGQWCVPDFVSEGEGEGEGEEEGEGKGEGEGEGEGE